MKHLTLAAALAALTALPFAAHAQEPAPHEGPCMDVATVEMGDPIVCTTLLTEDGEPLFARLTWDILADTDELHVTRIETAAMADDPAIATFSDLDLRAPLSFQANGFEFLDMNFDGYADFRLIEFLPAGPNAVYFNAVYDPETGRHTTAPGLNALSAPVFDAGDKAVTSVWRGSAATHGEDVFQWVDGTLLLVSRTETTYEDGDKCMMTRLVPRGAVRADQMVEVETGEIELNEVLEAPCDEF